MPKVGLRNIKTAVAVFLCLSLYILIILFSNLFKNNWDQSVLLATQIYTPFFACIGAAYSISTDRGKSLFQAKVRVISSLIGGLFGVLIVTVYTKIFKLDWPFQHISATGNPTNGFLSGDFNLKYILSFIIPILLTLLSCVAVVWLCNLLKQKNASFVAVLTLTAVMTSLGTSPIIYGFNRILSTIIGVLIALGVNLCHLPHYKNKEDLFLFSIDGIYKKDNEAMNGFSYYKTNHLLVQGAALSIYTTRTPGLLQKMMGDIPLNFPVVCMSGAALYDFKEKKYLYLETMENSLSKGVYDCFKDYKINPFVNFVKDNLLYTYTEQNVTPAELAFADQRKNIAYTSYVEGVPPLEEILYFIAILSKEQLNQIQIEFEKRGLTNQVLMLTFDCLDVAGGIEGYTYLKVYSKKVLELHSLDKLKNGYQKIVGLGVHDQDFYLLKKCDVSVTTNKSSLNLQKTCTDVLKDQREQNIVLFKKAEKLFHTK